MTYRAKDHPQYNDIARYETLEGWQEVVGYDFDRPFDFREFLAAYGRTGIQATNLARGIGIMNEMRESGARIFLSCTSNMVSSGLREIMAFLAKHNHVHVLVMAAGAVEEDIIKTLKPFVIGRFDVPGSMLFEKGIGRIGNIFAPYERYLHFEKFMKPFIDKIYALQQSRSRPLTPSEFIRELGLAVDDERSILYWAARNDIPVYCPALTDGAIGDMLTFAKERHKDLYLDIVGDSHRIYRYVMNNDLTGAILLGGGASKHFVLNANIFKDGLDYAVYVTTAHEQDASDSGGSPQEAITWAKLKPQAPHVKILCEATIAFPLLVAGSFGRG